MSRVFEIKIICDYCEDEVCFFSDKEEVTKSTIEWFLESIDWVTYGDLDCCGSDSCKTGAS